MDIDIPEVQPSTSKTRLLPVDDAHPFELEPYINGYSGRAAMDRIAHIISVCPSLSFQALVIANEHMAELRDPSLYQNVLNAYQQISSQVEDLPPLAEIAPNDSTWADTTSGITKKNQAERVKLEVELKTYANNMIKESIRMGHRDLGDFFRATGDGQSALKHYTKSREYCTTPQHVLDMCMSVLELLIEQRNYSHIPTYVYKAEAALDAASAAAAKQEKEASNDASRIPTTVKKSDERSKVQTKLDFATALSFMCQGNFDKAAPHLFRMGPPSSLGDWLGKFVAPGDIAIYGTLCALSSLSRSAIKSQLLENSSFGIYIESEPYVRELVDAYMASNFKLVLELLERYSTRHGVDIHLSPRITALTNMIRDWAVILYFKPFSSIKLERMSEAFGWTVDEVENAVVSLIQSGRIQGRVDRQNKILQAKKTDHRAELFARAMQAGEDMQSANRKLLLRMRLQQADLLIKAPKGGNMGINPESMYPA